MSLKTRFITLTALGLLVLVAFSGALPAAHAQSSPSVAVSLSDASVEQGTAITATMSFRGLTFDSDTSTTDYAFRADVTGANDCEGSGLGRTRYMYKVDDDPEVRSGTVSASCPAGDYTIRATISTPQSVALASATASFTVAAPTPEAPAPPIEVDLSPASPVAPDTDITVTMSFNGLEPDADTATTDYTFRADVLDSEYEAADDCEGNGLGADRYMYKVDEDPETRSGTIAAGCPVGDYNLKVSITTPQNLGLALIFRFSIEEEPAVAGAAGDAAGEPTISGTNLVGQTLTANQGTIADTDGVPAESTFTYQWIRVSSGSEDDISGATSKTYTTVSADEGKKLKVTVSFTDNANNAESRTSFAVVIGATSCTPAAPQDAIWSACLTVDQGGYFFENADDNYGALSNPDVTVGGTTYTIDSLEAIGTSFYLSFTSAPGNAASGWVLHIGSADQFALSAAAIQDAGKRYKWVDADLGWPDGDVISVWIAAAATNNPPVFPSGAITRSVEENTRSGQNVGSPVAATDADGDTLTYSLEGADSGSFTIVSTSGQIQTSAWLNYEDKSSYSVTVKVNDGTVDATTSVTISVTDIVEPPGVPAAPTVSAKAGTTDSLDVSWGAPANTGPAIDDYNVQYRIGTTGSFTSHPFTGTGRSTTITGLNASTSYQVQVQAHNDEGDSLWSASATASTNAPGNAAPTFPGGTVTRSVAENTAANTNIGSPVAATDTDSGDTLTYSLEGTDGGSFTIDSTSGQIQISAALNYEAKTSYSVTVRVNDGTVDVTKEVTISVTDVDEPPDQPAAPTVSAKAGTTDSLDVSWTAPANTERPAIDDYNVQYRIGSTGSFTIHSFTGTGRSTTIAGLTADTEYEVQVQAHNDEGDSPWSASATASTNAPGNAAPQSNGAALVSNTGQAAGRYFSLSDSGISKLAQRFTTGPNEGGYRLRSIGVQFGNVPAASSDVVVTIRLQTEREVDPAETAFATLTNPATFTANAVNTFTAPANTVLAASTTYFVHVEFAASATIDFSIGGTQSTDEDSGAAEGWSIGDTGRRYTVQRGRWDVHRGYAYQITVAGSAVGAVSSDATLSELTLSGVALSPAFASGTITYTASVDNSVSATTVTAATTHDKATRKILIGGVQDLNADVDLALGDNTITVEVTAEDGVTTKTYTVTVTRAAPAAAAGVPNIVVAVSKEVFDRPGGYRERDLIIALYNLESDATRSGDNYSGEWRPQHAGLRASDRHPGRWRRHGPGRPGAPQRVRRPGVFGTQSHPDERRPANTQSQREPGDPGRRGHRHRRLRQCFQGDGDRLDRPGLHTGRLGRQIRGPICGSTDLPVRRSGQHPRRFRRG